jgi:hypothetical protein
LYNKRLESKVRKRKISIRTRTLSTHKIYVSKGEYKHTNNNVIINIYTYNKQKYNYLHKISNKKKEKKTKKLKIIKNIKYNFKKRLFIINNNKNNTILIRKDIIPFLKKNFYLKKFLEETNLKNIKKKLNILKKKKYEKDKKIKFINKYLKYKNQFLYLKLLNHINNMYKRKLLNKVFKKHILKIYYKRLLLINQLKYKYTYLNKFINLINKIYNKNIELNIINLKYFYLNSIIFTRFITNKLLKKGKKAARKLKRIIKLSLKKVKVKKKRNKLYLKKIFNKYKHNYPLKYLKYKKPNISYTVNKKLKKNLENLSKYKIKYKILNSIKYKNIAGIRLKISGRISKRYTASRSIHVLKYKGSLGDISNKKNKYLRLSSKIIRNNTRPDVQFTNINSTIRTGSFGIKG